MKKVRILALLSAIATGVLLYIFLSSLNKPVEIEKTGVLTAVVNIPADTPITAEMIALTELPSEAVLPGSISDPAQVIGKICKAQIYTGEQMLASKLVSPGSSDSNTLAYAIEPGMRAITIAVNETSGLAFMITPGNHIDIIGQFMYKNEGGKTGSGKTGIASSSDSNVSSDTSGTPGSAGANTAGTSKASGAADPSEKSYTMLVLENVTVIAVDRVLSKKGKVNSDSPAYATLTLEVTPKQAMELNMAQAEGQLRAILRSPLDDKITELPGITLEEILREYINK